MKVLDSLLQLLLLIITVAIVTGGGVLNFSGVKIEVSSVDAWAFALTLILALISVSTDLTKLKTWQKLEQFITLLEKKSSTKTLVISTLVIFGLIFLGHVFRHWSFNTNALDMTYLNQPLFHAFGDPLMKCDLCDGPTRFSNHIGFTLYLIAPLTSFFQSDLLVMFIQVLLIGGASLALIKYGPLSKRSDLWLFALLILISHKAARNGLLWDFKEDHMGQFFFILSYLFLSQKKIVLFCLSLMAVLVSKEHTMFIVPLMAIPLWFEKDLPYTKKERLNLIAFVLWASLIWGISVFGFFLDYFKPPQEGAGKPAIIGRLGIAGESKSEVLMNLFFNPKTWWFLIQEKLLKADAIKYLVILYLPFLYLLRKRWWWIAASLSAAAINIVSTFWTMRTFAYHYETFILPTLLFGAILALKDIQSKKSFVWVLLLMLCVSGRWPLHALTKFTPTLGQVKDSYFLKNLPDDDGIFWANANALAHLSQKRNIAEIFPSTKELNYNDKNTHVIIDATKDHELELLDYLADKGLKDKKLSPSGRFIYVKIDP